MSGSRPARRLGGGGGVRRGAHLGKRHGANRNRDRRRSEARRGRPSSAPDRPGWRWRRSSRGLGPAPARRSSRRSHPRVPGARHPAALARGARGGRVARTLVERGNDAVEVRLRAGERVVPIRLFDLGLEDTAYPFLLFLSQAKTERAPVRPGGRVGRAAGGRAPRAA